MCIHVFHNVIHKIFAINGLIYVALVYTGRAYSF